MRFFLFCFVIPFQFICNQSTITHWRQSRTLCAHVHKWKSRLQTSNESRCRRSLLFICLFLLFISLLILWCKTKAMKWHLFIIDTGRLNDCINELGEVFIYQSSNEQFELVFENYLLILGFFFLLSCFILDKLTSSEELMLRNRRR